MSLLPTNSWHCIQRTCIITVLPCIKHDMCNFLSQWAIDHTSVEAELQFHYIQWWIFDGLQNSNNNKQFW